MTGIQDTTECRRHCHTGDVEWFGLPGCWHCGHPGDIGPVPTLEGLPSIASVGSTRYDFRAHGLPEDEDFRL